MDPIRTRKYLDFLSAGMSQKISTAPDTKAAIRTKSHCSQKTWIVHSTATGMYMESEYPYRQNSDIIVGDFAS